MRECIENLKIFQHKFSEDYSFEKYVEWNYKQSTGLLALFKKVNEINFK